ncbi:MAG: thioredoxin domain-containing protein [Candidatus Obscuribacter sp.]|nr:redoxin domain-containing protein [Candidatus Melainabacteria bacterium]MDX1985792.1 thioredoxin domain-containing protein [Candidatus Obscuribacter sp.]
MSTFGIVIGVSIVVGIVIAYFGWRKDRRAAQDNDPKAVWVDNEDFDGTVGEEFPNPNATRVALTDLDDDNFDPVKLSESKTPLVIKFFTTWCSGCKTQGPLMEQAAARFAGKAEFYQVDCDLSDHLPSKGKITKIPTTFFINPATKTQIVHVGVLTADQVGEMLKELAAESARGTQVQVDSEHPYLLG